MPGSKFPWSTDFISIIWPGLAGAKRGSFRSAAPRYLRYLAQTVYLTPLLLGFASAYLFAEVPQMQEIYLGIIEDRDFQRGLLGLATISLFSALLYAWNHTEVTQRIDAIYPDHADILFDRRVFAVRDLKTSFASSLPFFGLFIGLGEVYRHVLDAGNAGLPQGDLPKALPGLPQSVAVAAAITLVVYAGLFLLLNRFRNKIRSQRWILYVCYCLTPFLIAVPIFASNSVVIGSRLAGPLMSTALVLIELAVVVRLLLWFLQRIFRLFMALPSGFLMVMDWLPLAVRQAAIAVLPLLAVAGIVARLILGGSGTAELQQVAAAKVGDDIAQTFQAWLAERKTGSGRYPVFIVAAQGGGIYAASTTAAFLATMQDHCPAFARHVFAISAVSGGSVGASLFNAAFADSIARGTNRKAAVDVEPGCDRFFAQPRELSDRLRKITQDDHISPVLAYLMPDFFGGLLPSSLQWREKEPSRKPSCGSSRSGWLGRDQILEKSFIYSFKRSRPSGAGSDYTVCPDQMDRNLLMRPFSNSWSEKGDVPALLLNATWVETGYRVAFSPFALQPFGGGTLYSFDKLYNKPSDPSLIEAAVISARFPGLMPPWTLNLDGGSRLTFVDGGYADSSGAATALQLYNKLQKAGGDGIDLYLIALTDKLKALTDKDVEPAGEEPVRSWLYDFFSPVTTLLSVRELQSRKAVTEAYTQLGDNMIVVQLDQKAFPLPLGWKLSGLSSDIIRLTIGDPARCPPKSERGDTALMIANRNSCELKRIVDLLSPITLSSQTLFPQPQPQAAKTLGSWEISPQ